MRLAYVMAFPIASLRESIDRFRIPFNSILGETFDYIPQDNSFKLITEQVLHEPPICAGHCESENFIFYANTNIKSSFWGKSIDIEPQSSAHIILKSSQDHIVYKGATSSIENIIFGKMYIEHHGEFSFSNSTTGDSGTLKLEKRGWGGSNAYIVHGEICDKSGKVRYKIEARWDSYLKAIDA